MDTSKGSDYNTGGHGCLEGYELILFDILSRLSVKTLMRFKTVHKCWQSIIEEDTYFRNFYLAQLETRRRCNGESTTTTLLIFPVRISKEPIEIKMISFPNDQQQQDRSPEEAAVIPTLPWHCFTSDVRFLSYPRHRNIEGSSIEILLQHRSTRRRMLEPVYGLVCYISFKDHGCVLVYNPSTREKTSWIRTRTSAVLERLYCEHKTLEGLTGKRLEALGCKPGDYLSTRYQCMFAFGFDLTTREHKVLCVYKIVTTELDYISEDHNGFKMPVQRTRSREIICEVMTVGENTWRKIDNDQFPSYLVPAQHSVHVNGSIYWMCYYENTRFEVIMAFDVGRETFSVIRVGHLILDLVGSDYRSQWVQERVNNQLVEIDGHLCLLDTEGDDLLNMWIYYEDHNEGGEGTSGYFVKETIQMTCPWDNLCYLAFKAIPGTDLIIIKPFQEISKDESIEDECFDYYDRAKKKYYKTKVQTKSNRNLGVHGFYDVTTFFETLFPVQRNKGMSRASPH